ncbi:MAG: glycosyltransferase [Elusimicrobiota bacterium]
MLILLPAYNEAFSLPDLAANIAQALPADSYRIILIDDGSTDGTAAVIENLTKKYPLSCISHSVNRGLGAAIKTGFKFAIREKDDYIITMDADNTHPPSAIIPMLEKLDSGIDVVIASRYAPEGKTQGVSVFRQVLSNGASLLLRLVFPIPGVRDYTSGFRAYRRETLAKAFQVYGDNFITAGDFSCMAEVLVKLAKLGIKAAEVPLHLRYDRKKGKSKIKIIRTIISYAKLIWKERI